MNPLRWTPAHKLGAVVICIIGALAGLFFAWMESASHAMSKISLSGEWADYSEVFLVWVRYGHYWPWPVLGAITAGLIVYAVQLLRA